MVPRELSSSRDAWRGLADLSRRRMRRMAPLVGWLIAFAQPGSSVSARICSAISRLDRPVRRQLVINCSTVTGRNRDVGEGLCLESLISVLGTIDMSGPSTIQEPEVTAVGGAYGTPATR